MLPLHVELLEPRQLLSVTVSAGGPYSVNLGQQVTLSATASDSQGESLTYAWDLNYDGSTFNAIATGNAVTFDPAQLGISSGSDTVAVQATNTDGSSALATAAVTIAASTTGTISGRVTEDGAGVAATAHVDGDNHYGLYYGGEDGSAITYIGRNEFGGDGSLGGYNWTDAETYNFHMPGSDYLYVAAWDGSQDIAGFLGEFDFANGSTLLSNPTDWSYTIAGPASGDNGNAPSTASLSNWIAAANSNNSWTTSSPDAVLPNCNTYNVPEISPSADDLWTTAFTDTFYNFVIFRAALPAGLASTGSGTATGVAGCTVFVDQQYDGQLDAGDPSAITDANGDYTITNVPPGYRNVFEETPSGQIQVAPLNPQGYTISNLAAGQAATGINFINTPDAASPGGYNSATANESPSADNTICTDTTDNLYIDGPDDGDSAATYTWSLIGNSPAPVTFSDNGDNSAQDITATFGATGTYTFEANVHDPSGVSNVTYLTIDVVPCWSSIAVTPDTPSVMYGDTLQFHSVATDQFGNQVQDSPLVHWIAYGAGSIDNHSGLYTAPDDDSNGSSATIYAQGAGGWTGYTTSDGMSVALVSTMMQNGVQIGLLGNFTPTNGQTIGLGDNPSYTFSHSGASGSLMSVLIQPPQDIDDPSQWGTDYSLAVAPDGDVSINLVKSGPYIVQTTYTSSTGQEYMQWTELDFQFALAGTPQPDPFAPWTKLPTPNQDLILVDDTPSSANPSPGSADDGALHWARAYLLSKGISFVPVESVSDAEAAIDEYSDISGFSSFSVLIVGHGSPGFAGVGGGLDPSSGQYLSLNSPDLESFEDTLAGDGVSSLTFYECEVGRDAPGLNTDGTDFLQDIADNGGSNAAGYTCNLGCSLDGFYVQEGGTLNVQTPDFD